MEHIVSILNANNHLVFFKEIPVIVRVTKSLNNHCIAPWFFSKINVLHFIPIFNLLLFFFVFRNDYVSLVKIPTSVFYNFKYLQCIWDQKYFVMGVLCIYTDCYCFLSYFWLPVIYKFYMFVHFVHIL